MIKKKLLGLRASDCTLVRSFLSKRRLCTGPVRWQQQRVQSVRASAERPHRVEVSGDKRKLTLLCQGEQLERRFHGLWLRHNCHCPVCTSAHTGQTIVDPKYLFKNLKVESASISGDQLNVEWSVSGRTVHNGSFDLDWLKDHDYSNPEQDHNNKPLVAVSISLTHNELLYLILLSITEGATCTQLQ